MRTPAVLATVLFSTFLTACGGGDPVSGVEPTPEPTGVSTVEVKNAAIGSGSGSGFELGVISIGESVLSAGGTTQITATIVDRDNENLPVVSSEYFVSFSSSCVSEGKAFLSKDSATTSSGAVSVSYTAAGCAGGDVVTFTLFNSNQSEQLGVATGALTVAPPEIGAISYVGASSPLISIATIGDAVLPKLTTLTFRVQDKSENPVANREVNFSLTNESGGTSLSLESSLTNENGEVSTSILAGTTHAITSVRAETLATDNETVIANTSQQISITTGIADQDSFSIALSKLSTWGWGTFGSESAVSVTAFVNDHFQNPVPDGTVVNFMADSGSIPSSCQTEAGTCSVTWISSAPLPGADESGQVFVNDSSRQYDQTKVTLDENWEGGLPGVATVMAYTTGEAGFSDSNGNNLFDDGESFVSLSEAFLDANENGIYDYDRDLNPREELVDFDNDGLMTAAPVTYQGITCSDNSTNCQSLVHVRDSASFIVASATTLASLDSVVGTRSMDLSGQNCVVIDDEDVELIYTISDINGNVPASGTKVDLSVGELDLVGASEFVVPTGTYGTSGVQVPFTVRADPDEPTFTPESPVLTISRVDGLEDTVTTELKLTSFTGITVGSNPALPRADTSIELTFLDACGQPVPDELSIIAELSNGAFTEGDDPLFQSFSVPAGTGSYALQITSDGTSSLDLEGITLTIFREGSTFSNEVVLALLD